MPRPGPKFGIRLQLLGLFGLLMFTGAAVLALDEFERQRNQQALVQLGFLPANFGTDPLIAAMVEPLRQWQSGGSAVQFAHVGANH